MADTVRQVDSQMLMQGRVSGRGRVVWSGMEGKSSRFSTVERASTWSLVSPSVVGLSWLTICTYPRHICGATVIIARMLHRPHMRVRWMHAPHATGPWGLIGGRYDWEAHQPRHRAGRRHRRRTGGTLQSFKRAQNPPGYGGHRRHCRAQRTGGADSLHLDRAGTLSVGARSDSPR